MTAITFDTLKFAETLKGSGFDENQAKGMAVAIQEVQKRNLEELATKADVQDVKRDIDGVRRDIKDLDTKIDTVKKEMELQLAAEIAPMKWAMVITVGGIVTILIRLFIGH